MRKLVWSINITPDGFCGHQSVIADDELHEHDNELLSGADIILFGRVTFQLFADYWPGIAEKKLGSTQENLFAEKISLLDKIVFTRTLDSVQWKNTKLVSENIDEEITALKHPDGKDIIIFGSPGFAMELTKMGLIDEYEFIIQPMLAGNGKRFFETEGLNQWVDLQLISSKKFNSGAFALRYKVNKD